MKAELSPPGPQGVAQVRSLVAYARDPLGALSDLAHQYGDIVHVSTKPVNAFLINHPEHIEDILVSRDWNFVPERPPTFSRAFHQSTASTDGYFHRRHRNLFEPMVDHEHMEPFAAGVVDCGREATERWRDGMTIETPDMMLRLAASVMGTMFFGAEAREHEQELNAVVSACRYLATRTTNPLGAVMESVRALPVNRRFWRAIDLLSTIIYRRIAERRVAGASRLDLLDLFIGARDTDGRFGMVDRQIRDELISIYMIPSILMGAALVWIWHLLARTPAVEARLHMEVDGVLGERAAPSWQDYCRLQYTERVVYESLRLLPPSWIVGRRAVQDLELGGYALPAGSVLLLSAYVTQRDARFFPDPLVFDPERWTPEARAGRAEYSYFPFSAGPRNCLGRHVARMALTLLVAGIARRWRLVPVSDRPVEPQALFALWPRGAMPVRLQLRVGSPQESG